MDILQYHLTTFFRSLLMRLVIPEEAAHKQARIRVEAAGRDIYVLPSYQILHLPKGSWYRP